MCGSTGKRSVWPEPTECEQGVTVNTLCLDGLLLGLLVSQARVSPSTGTKHCPCLWSLEVFFHLPLVPLPTIVLCVTFMSSLDMLVIHFPIYIKIQKCVQGWAWGSEWNPCLPCLTPWSWILSPAPHIHKFIKTTCHLAS